MGNRGPFYSFRTHTPSWDFEVVVEPEGVVSTRPGFPSYHRFTGLEHQSGFGFSTQTVNDRPTESRLKK